MSDVSSSATLAVVGSMELFEKSGLNILAEREVAVRDTRIHAFLIATDSTTLWGITRSGGRQIFAHAVDYRANVDALLQLGVHDVVSTGMVGSLRPSIHVGSLMLVDQFIDFTTLTPHTYFEDDQYRDFDFSSPYCARLRQACSRAASHAGVDLVSDRACYVGSDGPRFETAAEVRAFAMLGGDVVGMTGVAECICARENGLCFATVVGVVNMGAGIGAAPLRGSDFLDDRAHILKRIGSLFARLPGALATQTPGQTCVACKQFNAQESHGPAATAQQCR